MRLQAPTLATDIVTQDIFGKPFKLSDFRGKRVMLSFFREAACPFCNFRIYEMTHEYKSWQQSGLEVVTVFTSPAEDVRKHVARHPRPFHMLSDPDLALYEEYGVEHSASAMLRAFLFNLPEIFRGLRTGGYFSLKNNPHKKVVPADFLLNEKGEIIATWYGRDTSDHIPLKAIEAFIKGAPVEPALGL